MNNVEMLFLPLQTNNEGGSNQTHRNTIVLKQTFKQMFK
jgi:hypothetical protein